MHSDLFKVGEDEAKVPTRIGQNKERNTKKFENRIFFLKKLGRWG